MDRDEKGRFVKGNTIGKRFKPSETDGKQTDTARKGGIASGEAKRERKMVAEVVARIMAEPSTREGFTKMDDFVEKAIRSVFTGDIDLRDLKLLQDILGEDVKNINLRTGNAAEAVRETLREMFGDDGQD